MAQVRWLDQDQQRAWRRLAAVTMLLPAALDAQLQREAGLTHFAYRVLGELSETPGRTLRMGDLAARTTASLSRLSHVVAGLERRGWVRREPSPDDGRVTVAVLTDAGWDEVAAAAPGHVRAVRELVVDALSAEQLAQLEPICAALLARLDPERRVAGGA